MKQLINEWRKYLTEQEKKFVRLPGHSCDITFKTGLLKELLKSDKKIKKLRVPGWSLQTTIYLHPDQYDYASVAYCQGEPIAIVTLTDDHARYEAQYGALNFFVDSWHRGMGLADKLFLDVMKYSFDREYIVASRGGRHMLEKHGYEKIDDSCAYVDCAVYRNKNFDEGSSDDVY